MAAVETTREQYEEALANIWKAHFTFVSAGATMGAFKRHVEPAIYNAAMLLPDDKRHAPMRDQSTLSKF